MKDTKRQLSQFVFYDRTGIQTHLEKMAEQGWLLEKITNFFWHYRRIEPQKMHFAVTYFSKASVFDPEPSEKQQTFREFCEHSGWKIAANAAQMEIFYNEAENPIPIETDALVELDSIHKTAKKGFLPSYVLLLFVIILQGCTFTYTLIDNPLYILTRNSSLLTGFFWIIIALVCIIELGSYLRWYIKAKATAELDGSFLETHTNKTFQHIMLFVLALLIILWICSFASSQYRFIGLVSATYMLVLIFLVNSIKTLLKKNKVSPGVNRTITLVSSIVLSFTMISILTFIIISNVKNHWLTDKPVETYEQDGWAFDIYHDELPLIIEDLIEIDCENYSYELNDAKSLLLEQYEAVQSPPHNLKDALELYYTITKVKFASLYNWVFDELYHKYNDWYDGSYYKKIDISPWNAIAAYQLCYDDTLQNRYLLCYEDCVVELNFYNFELSVEQMKIISEKLKLL